MPNINGISRQTIALIGNEIVSRIEAIGLAPLVAVCFMVSGFMFLSCWQHIVARLKNVHGIEIGKKSGRSYDTEIYDNDPKLRGLILLGLTLCSNLLTIVVDLIITVAVGYGTLYFVLASTISTIAFFCSLKKQSCCGWRDLAGAWKTVMFRPRFVGERERTNAIEGNKATAV